MKIKIVILGILLTISTYMVGQDLEARVTVNRDSILLGNTLTLSVSIDGESIEGIDVNLPENLEIVSGPNVSSTMTMMNGTVIQTATYNYIIKPIEVGTDYIPPMVITTSKGVIETDPVTIDTYPNPTNIQQDQEMLSPFGRGFDFGSMFGGENMQFNMEELFGGEGMQMDLEDLFGGDLQSLFDNPMFEQFKGMELPDGMTPPVEEEETVPGARTLKRI